MQIGDTVSTKEHDCKMTIGEIKDNSIFCQWFIGEQLQEKWYEVSELTKC